MVFCKSLDSATHFVVNKILEFSSSWVFYLEVWLCSLFTLQVKMLYYTTTSSELFSLTRNIYFPSRGSLLAIVMFFFFFCFYWFWWSSVVYRMIVFFLLLFLQFFSFFLFCMWWFFDVFSWWFSAGRGSSFLLCFLSGGFFFFCFFWSWVNLVFILFFIFFLFLFGFWGWFFLYISWVFFFFLRLFNGRVISIIFSLWFFSVFCCFFCFSLWRKSFLEVSDVTFGIPVFATSIDSELEGDWLLDANLMEEIEFWWFWFDQTEDELELDEWGFAWDAEIVIDIEWEDFEDSAE